MEEKIIYEKIVAQIEAHVGKSHPAGHENNQSDENAHLIHAFRELGAYIHIQEQMRVNNAYRPLVSNRKIIGPLIVFAKKVVRKLLKWYIEPVCNHQSAFNSAVTPSVGRLTEISNALMHKQNQSTLHLDALRAAYEALTAQHNALTAQHNADTQATRDALAHNHTRLETLTAQQNTDNQALHAFITDNHIRLDTLAAQHNTDNQAMRELTQLMSANVHQIADKLFKFDYVQDDMAKQLQIANEQITRLQDKLEQLERDNTGLFTEMTEPGVDVAYGTLLRMGSFSQAGEDSIVHFLLQALEIPARQVSYLDLGANHAKELSNTYHFYKRGARGVLVEANPALIPELKFYRHGDTILHRAVAEESDKVIRFYVLTGDGLSTTDKAAADAFMAQNPHLAIREEVDVQTITVNEIMETYWGQAPTLLNIDIEGSEMEVLESIDFEKYRPLVVIIEMIPYTYPFSISPKNKEIAEYMTVMGYHEFAFTGINAIFTDTRKLKELGRMDV